MTLYNTMDFHLSLSPRACPGSCSLSWWYHPVISSSEALSPPSALNFSQHQGLFQWVICSHQMTKMSSSNECSGLISIKIDWFDILAIQGTFRSLLQPALEFKDINSLVLCLLYSQLLQPHMTNGKIIALTIWTFVGRVMSLLFNTLSRFVICC